MNDEQLKAMWQQVAIQIGDDIFRMINTADTVGTEHESGYILMFFNTHNHQGRATMVSSTTNKAELKHLLKVAMRSIDRAAVVYPGKSN